MSRAFVKENDLEHAGIDVPERPVSAHANYVTRQGLLQLEAEAANLEQQRSALRIAQKDPFDQEAYEPMVRQKIAMLERDLRYIGARLSNAILIDATSQDAPLESVLFGAMVTVEDDNGQQHLFKIVGEDEADISCNKVSYISPIAKALIGRKIGDVVEWMRPVGEMQLTVIKIQY